MNGTWNEHLICAELAELVESLGRYPSGYWLNNNGYGYLASAVKKHGGNQHFRALMKLNEGSRPDGYWKVFENVRIEIEDGFEELVERGFMPTQRMLNLSGASALASGIARWHGGTQNVAQKMGLVLSSLLRGSDGKFYRSEYEIIVADYLASRGIVYEINIPILDGAKYTCDFRVENAGRKYAVEVWGYSKGHNSSRAKAYNEKRKRKENIYKTTDLILVSVEEQHLLPINTCEPRLDRIFREIGFDVTADRHFDPVLVLRKAQTELSNDEIMRAIKPVFGFYGGHVPMLKQLEKDGHHAWVIFIEKTGGINAMRERFGESRTQRQQGYWTEPMIIKHLQSVLSEIGHFPTERELRQMGRTDLTKAIQRQGGMSVAREWFGETPIYERWSKARIFDTLRKSFGYFPTKTELEAAKLFGLCGAIGRRGGFAKLRREYKRYGVTA